MNGKNVNDDCYVDLQTEYVLECKAVNSIYKCKGETQIGQKWWMVQYESNEHPLHVYHIFSYRKKKIILKISLIMQKNEIHRFCK